MYKTNGMNEINFCKLYDCVKELLQKQTVSLEGKLIHDYGSDFKESLSLISSYLLFISMENLQANVMLNFEENKKWLKLPYLTYFSNQDITSDSEHIYIIMIFNFNNQDMVLSLVQVLKCYKRQTLIFKRI